MLNNIFSNFWILILLYTGFVVYEIHLEHTEEFEGLKQRIPAVESQLRKRKKEKNQIKKYLDDIDRAKEQIELVALEVEKVQKKLPDTIDDAENLRVVKEIAEKLNIKNPLLSPTSEENKGFYYTKVYELVARGTFLQFLILLEKLQDNSRLLNVTKVTFEKPKKVQRGRFQVLNANILIEAYRYNKNYRESRGFEDIEKEFEKKKKEAEDKARKKKKKGKKKKKKKKKGKK